MRWRLQKLQHSQSTMSVGRSSSNGNTGTARLAAPRLLPRAPDSMFESFSEYGGMTLNSSLPSSSCCCSSCSLSSICKKKGKERVILPINRRGGAWREVRYVNVRGKIGQNSQQNLKAHEDISCGEETTRRLNCYIKTCCNSLTAFQSIFLRCLFHCVWNRSIWFLIIYCSSLLKEGMHPENGSMKSL